jgi:hypothetical protein
MNQPSRPNATTGRWRARPVFFWLVVVLLLLLDWRNSTPHDRFAEPPPLALGSGPSASAGHCSLAPQ